MNTIGSLCTAGITVAVANDPVSIKRLVAKRFTCEDGGGSMLLVAESTYIGGTSTMRNGSSHSRVDTQIQNC